MQLHFYLKFHTEYGERLSLAVPDGTETPLTYLNEELWTCSLQVDPAQTPVFAYGYRFYSAGGRLREEWDPEREINLQELNTPELQVLDHWNAMGDEANAFLTQPFTKIFFPQEKPEEATYSGHCTHIFRVKAPLLEAHESLCLTGGTDSMGRWNELPPVPMSREGLWLTARLDLSEERFPIAYKYAVWNSRTGALDTFEQGDNRILFASDRPGVTTLIHDGFARLPYPQWRGAGVAIPVFSLRSAKSYGVGEFTDLPLLGDWAAGAGLKLVQLLPINDTTATHTWVDSYPYSAISAFALHPLFLNPAELAGKKHATLLKPYEAERKKLNALTDVDYDAVIKLKWAIFTRLYEAMRAEWENDPEYALFLAENSAWLLPYAAFCYLRDVNGTAEFQRWKTHQTCDLKAIEPFFKPDFKDYHQVAIHLFVQYQLHRQLRAAVDYLHRRQIAVKGDIPIGIYRFSADAWQAPALYHMDKQAGAPPDDFAVAGQNWGFPTYNWPRMQADGFAWWRMRFAQMSRYFDAFRIDHILGFFRIWSIPQTATQGILGYFVPALPFSPEDLFRAGVMFDKERFCRPYITDHILWQTFGEQFRTQTAPFLKQDARGRYAFLPAFDTQAKVVAHFDPLIARDPTPAGLRDGLLNLLANVLLIESEEQPGYFHPRIALEQTSSFRDLPPDQQRYLHALATDYFFRRHELFWEQEALKKLPALKRATRMLVCGEDLGMVPHCVPGVMRDLGILSLEIQRMPKQADRRFFHPKDAPYLSVVTPSTHDMSTVRGWWEEDRENTARFFREVLEQYTPVPYYCEPWVNQLIVWQHLASPAMWSIFQLQDLLGMDGRLRRQNPDDERINVPANPKHYWRYRMHLTLEELQGEKGFNAGLRELVERAGRK
ncbi:MAG: 4-alpha-glucanotransferase [Saprospiraceae bacterium]|nr:4-alpha-glucanotransferase [Saprospiraceae bacterium]